MTGAYEIIVKNKRLTTRLEIDRNISVIRGDSATGKTTLIQMIRDYYLNGNSSGVEIICAKKCVVILNERNWQEELSQIDDSIVFFDEDSKYIITKEFASAIKHTNNYYVLITRDDLAQLPYSVNAIYGLRVQQKYSETHKVYNETYPIYPVEFRKKDGVLKPELVITEDSNSGYDFFNGISKGKYSVISANSKSGFINLLEENGYFRNYATVLLIADGAAFGSMMNSLMMLIGKRQNIFLYIPESFEYLILKSGIFDSVLINHIIPFESADRYSVYADTILKEKISTILENTSDYADSSLFFSWERFYTFLLCKASLKTEKIFKSKKFVYTETKSRLPEVYLTVPIADSILKAIEFIDF